MASNPPQFQVEDQTDEDFFDNLVNEDVFGGTNQITTATTTSASTSAVSDRITADSIDSDSDDTKAFSNLTIDDSGNDLRQKIGSESIADRKSEPDDSKHDFVTGSIAENKMEWNGWEQNIGAELNVDNESDLNAGSLMESNNESDVKDGIGFGDGTDLVAGKNSGSVIKEVGWNSFYADPTEHNGNHHGFGSYSDFFSDLGDNSVELPGKVEGNANAVLNANGEAISRNEESNAGALIENSIDYGNYSLHRDSQIYGAEENTNGPDLNSTAYWESMYPGWKYDANTGQWYHVDVTANIHQGSSDAASGSDRNVISEKSEFSYLKQGSQSFVGTVAETSMSESVSNWKSQVSHVDNNGYPDHMVFDPQYPGWYYDTIAQEWHALETYNLSEQSTVQAHDQQRPNGFAFKETHLNNSNSMYSEFGQADNYGSKGDGIPSLYDKPADNHGYQGLGNINQRGSWAESHGNYNQQGPNIWQPDTGAKAMSFPNFGQNQQVDNIYGSKASVNNHVDQQNAFSSMRCIPSYNEASQGHGGEANGIAAFQSFVPSGDFTQQFNQAYVNQNAHMQHSNNFSVSQKQLTLPQQPFHSDYQNSYAPNMGRSSAGRPAHALVAFGFGGKLIVMKDNGSLQNSTFGSQGHVEGSISILNLMEVVPGNTDASSTRTGAYDYFLALCQQSFPGPLVGGSVGSKELNRWIDERIANCESPDMDYRKGEVLKLLLSLLKIACQHYGKLRSPFGTDTTLRESDTPESAVAKLFASSKKDTRFGALNHCLQNLPSEGQIQATASEVQNLLVSGRKKEALLCAQDGQLWGPALILASQLGEQFYVDTVKQMALRQLIAGSPLRTLCLLIAGQPADVFSTEVPAVNGFPGAVTMSQQSTNFGNNGMLDDWEENLAVITANRTKDDELVIIHLGDCLWKNRSEITVAHICYLVAEANFESYSDSARLCLIGADHWKFPRTYASPEAIQRTEIYEYSKVLGNSQFSLLPFQPYKLIYAYMLAEVGKVSDSLKYCQALSKSLKTGRAPEVETLRQLVLSLEERIKIHQQGGYTANLAPAKLVGKLLNFFDSTAHRVVGGLPPPAPSISQGSVQSNEQDPQLMGRVSGSQSTMAMSSLMPSASMEPINDWATDGNKKTMHNRSVSEPDFGRTPRQVDSSMDSTSSSAEGKAPGSGGSSRFSRFGFGSGLLQKTVGLVLRPRGDKQAKLGEKNKFYYDEKLKRWVEEGAGPPAEEPDLASPPTTAAFQNGTSDYNLQSALKSEGSPSTWSPMIRTPTISENSSGIPPIPTSTNQFSSRGRMGVRSRYVDTFHQGKASPVKSFQSPSIPSVKPAVAANAKFFVPTPASPAEQPMEAIAENVPEESATNEKPSTSIMNDSLLSPASSMTRQRFPSMENIPSGFMTNGNNSLPPHSRRTASWSGSFPNGLNPNLTETRSLGEVVGMPSSSFMPSPMNGASFGDELHEVEL